MFVAFIWGAVAGSSVLLGSMAGLWTDIPKRLLGWVMAYGVGVLIGAATFDLLIDSFNRGGMLPTGLGFILGAFLFTIINGMIGNKGGAHRKRSTGIGQKTKGIGLAIFFGTLLDAIPESVILGVGLQNGDGINWVMLSAIVVSNFPEGLSSTVGLRRDGYSKRKIIWMWSVVMVMAAVSSALGYLLPLAHDVMVASLIHAFAAGAVVSMVASTMMPEAYEEGGALVGLITAGGLLSAMLLVTVS